MNQNKNAVLFLDRDGTINIDIGPKYVSDPSQILLIPGAGHAIVAAQKAGFKIGIITNQAGVAKGFTKPEAFARIHARLEQLIAQEAQVGSFKFDDIRICMHHPDEKCRCRKPQSQMLEEALSTLDADKERSFFIGDKETDLMCARRGGIRSILVRTGHGSKVEVALASFPDADPSGVVDALPQAVELAIRLRNAV